MKTRAARFVVLCAVAWCALPALAQVPITANDVSERFSVGRTISYIDDTLATSINIGAPGPTSWDFSGLAAHRTTLAASIAKPTPFDSAFPGATHVLKTTLSGNVVVSGIAATVSGDLYLYFTVGAGFLSPGTYGIGTASTVLFPGSPPTVIPGTMKLANAPADVSYPLPLTYGASWRSTYTSTQTVSLAIPLPITPTVTNYDISYTVDAYGPMKMPGGGVQNALRIRKIDRAGAPTLGYIFLSETGASVQVTAIDTLASDSGTIPIRQKSVAWTPAVVVGVAEEGGTPSAFSLAQNYPNPFNPSTVIRYQVPEAGDVKLVVVDMLGREVAVLVNERRSAGVHEVTFDGAGLPSGVYFYRLQAGDVAQTRKLLLVR
jgi:hypothetical protein